MANLPKNETTFKVKTQAEIRFFAVFRQPTTRMFRNQVQKPQGDEICENDSTQNRLFLPTCQK